LGILLKCRIGSGNVKLARSLADVVYDSYYLERLKRLDNGNVAMKFAFPLANLNKFAPVSFEAHLNTLHAILNERKDKLMMALKQRELSDKVCNCL
jgi:hypothetical protein